MRALGVMSAEVGRHGSVAVSGVSARRTARVAHVRSKGRDRERPQRRSLRPLGAPEAPEAPEKPSSSGIPDRPPYMRPPANKG